MASIASVCVYCGSSLGANPRHAEAARQLGAHLAAHGIRLVYGGGRIGLMGQVADASADARDDGALYADGARASSTLPGHIPPPLQAFARAAWRRATRDPRVLERALGEWLSEPKPRVWFEPGPATHPWGGGRPLALDRRTRMLYDARHVYINGESLRATGRDAQCLRRLADARALPASDVRRLSRAARDIVQQWLSSGWVHER